MKLTNFHNTQQCKNPRKSKGFTLIELIVVMAVLAILASVSYGPIMSMKDKGKYTETISMANDIRLASEAFNQEYLHLPYTGANYPNNDTLILTNSDTGVDFLQVLTGEDTTINDKARTFLSVKSAKSSRNGMLENGQMLDHWGNPFSILLNYDGDEDLDSSVIDASYSDTVRGQELIIATPGKSKVFGKDKDAKTW